MSEQAFYFNEYGIIHTRDQWIEIFEYQMKTGFLKDHLDQVCPEGVHLFCAQSFERMVKDRELIYYGIVEVDDYEKWTDLD